MKDVLGWVVVAAAATVLAYLFFTVPPANPAEPPVYIERLTK